MRSSNARSAASEMNQRSPAPGASPGSGLHSRKYGVPSAASRKSTLATSRQPSAWKASEAVTLERGRLRRREHGAGLVAARSPATAASRRTSTAAARRRRERRSPSAAAPAVASPSSPTVISRPPIRTPHRRRAARSRVATSRAWRPKACLVVARSTRARCPSTTLRARASRWRETESRRARDPSADAMRQERGVAIPAARTRVLARDLSSVMPSVTGSLPVYGNLEQLEQRRHLCLAAARSLGPRRC